MDIHKGIDLKWGIAQLFNNISIFHNYIVKYKDADEHDYMTKKSEIDIGSSDFMQIMPYFTETLKDIKSGEYLEISYYHDDGKKESVKFEKGHLPDINKRLNSISNRLKWSDLKTVPFVSNYRFSIENLDNDGQIKILTDNNGNYIGVIKHRKFFGKKISRDKNLNAKLAIDFDNEEFITYEDNDHKYYISNLSITVGYDKYIRGSMFNSSNSVNFGNCEYIVVLNNNKPIGVFHGEWFRSSEIYHIF